MPVQIGAKVHSFADPTGLLSDCHRRVEMFLGALRAVAEVIDQPAAEETRRSLESALRYFREAAPKHTADEEESVFPRLRKISNPEIGAALTKMEELEQEHRWAAPLHAQVQRVGEQYLSTGRVTVPDIEVFRSSVAALAAMYAHHIDTEEELVFPVAARVLPETEKAAIAHEMARRRAVPMVDGGSRDPK
jgi:hemerythrin-like domain-containing protein